MDKKSMRARVHDARNRLGDKDERSRRIKERLFSLPEYQDAETVKFYVDVRSEVRTKEAIREALQQGKKAVVPYCKDEQLELFHLEDMDELETGAFGILEPKPELRELPEKKVDITEVDFIITPGVVFDRGGGRCGHGFGYYDKLLKGARPDAPLVALAFECQFVEEVPMEDHDVHIDMIVTEEAVYEGKRAISRRRLQSP